MEWISTVLQIIQAAHQVKDIAQYLDKQLAEYGGLEGFCEQYGISQKTVLNYAREVLGLDSDDSDSEDSDETATVMCPNCGAFVVADDGNGTYPCGECGEDFEVGVFDGAFTSQDNNDSSGWAVAEWLVKSFDIPSDSDEIRSQLEDSHEEGEVADPDVFMETMRDLGLKPWEPKDEDDKETIFDDDNAFADDVFEDGGQIAVCFQFEKKGLGRHWVGLELLDGEVRVMDPEMADGYWSLEDWREAIKVGRIIAVFGFTV